MAVAAVLISYSDRRYSLPDDDDDDEAAVGEVADQQLDDTDLRSAI